MRLLYYNPKVALRKEDRSRADLEKFSVFFSIFGPTTVLVDRTETIEIPFKVRSMFPIPTFRPMGKTFEDICNERASELLVRAENLEVSLCVFYSGGVDSTLVLISLLKNATPKQKMNLTVLLSEESIYENPNFYRNHICGKLNVEPSNMFPYLFGTKRLFVGGEFNDQLFGSNLMKRLVDKHGPSIIHQPYNQDLLLKFFNRGVKNNEFINFYLDIFERLRDVAPVNITTNQDYLWWINFTLKWQSVFMRMLCYTAPRNVSNIDESYVTTYYNHFYGTEDFQLWSLNNQDKKIKDSWKSYKWVCKDIIYEYTKDADYRDNKTKNQSLAFILMQQNSFGFIDESFGFWNTLDMKNYSNPKNDFA